MRIFFVIYLAFLISPFVLAQSRPGQGCCGKEYKKELEEALTISDASLILAQLEHDWGECGDGTKYPDKAQKLYELLVDVIAKERVVNALKPNNTQACSKDVASSVITHKNIIGCFLKNPETKKLIDDLSGRVYLGVNREVIQRTCIDPKELTCITIKEFFDLFYTTPINR